MVFNLISISCAVALKTSSITVKIYCSLIVLFLKRLENDLISHKFECRYLPTDRLTQQLDSLRNVSIDGMSVAGRIPASEI